MLHRPGRFVIQQDGGEVVVVDADVLERPLLRSAGGGIHAIDIAVAIDNRLRRQRVRRREERRGRRARDVVAETRAPMNRRIQLLLAGLHRGAEVHDVTGGLEGEGLPDVQAIRRRGFKHDALWRRGGVDLVGDGIPVHRDAIDRLVEARARRRIVHGEDERRDPVVAHAGGQDACAGHEIERLAGVVAELLQDPMHDLRAAVRENRSHLGGLDNDLAGVRHLQRSSPVPPVSRCLAPCRCTRCAGGIGTLVPGPATRCTVRRLRRGLPPQCAAGRVARRGGGRRHHETLEQK